MNILNFRKFSVKPENKTRFHVVRSLGSRRVRCKIKNKISGVLANKLKIQSELDSKIDLMDQVAQVVHDIRSPIAAMEICLHMLSREVQSESLTVITSAVQSIRDTTDNLLDKYRINRNAPSAMNKSLKIENYAPATQLVYLADLIKSVLSMKRFEWIDRPHHLSFSCSPQAKTLKLDFSVEKIKRIISNLLNNAIEACVDLASIKVYLNVWDSCVFVSIIDNGVGILPEKLSNYLTGESSKHVGNGLGLSTAVSYMKSIGGDLTVQSRAGRGTLVQLIFNVF
jgi:signal transduction histidine kinase